MYGSHSQLTVRQRWRVEGCPAKYLPVDKHIVESEIKNESLQLGLEDMSLIIRLQVRRLIDMCRVYRLAIHGRC